MTACVWDGRIMRMAVRRIRPDACDCCYIKELLTQARRLPDSEVSAFIRSGVGRPNQFPVPHES